MNNISIIGRSIKTDSKINGFLWTGSGIEFTTNSSSLIAEIECPNSEHEIWIIATLNDAVILRQMLLPGINKVGIYSNLNSENTKHVKILKDSQADIENSNQFFTINSLTDCNGKTIETFAVPNRPISIEFIGDSITSGEGLKGSINDYDFSYTYTSFDNSYVKLVTDYLNADYSVTSQCGYGIRCGWNNDPKMIMPHVYKYSDGSKIEYDFDSKKFDFVVINLGTNDNGAFEMESYIQDGKEYKITTEDFIHDGIHFLNFCLSKNPYAKIIWFIGFCPIQIERHIKTIIRECAEPNRVTFLKAPCADDYDYGSRQHPGIKTHRKAAEILARKIEELQGIN